MLRDSEPKAEDLVSSDLDIRIYVVGSLSQYASDAHVITIVWFGGFAK
jgi:hypothetical protein